MQPSAVANPVSPVVSLRSRFHWSHAVLAVGLLAISGAGTALVFKVLIIDSFSYTIHGQVFCKFKNATM